MEIIKTGGGIKRRDSLAGEGKRERTANPTFWMTSNEKALVHIAVLATAKLASLIHPRRTGDLEGIIEETRKFLGNVQVPDIPELANRLDPKHIEATLAIIQDLEMDVRIAGAIEGKTKREFTNGAMLGMLLMAKIVDATDPNDPSTEMDAFTLARQQLAGQRLPKSDFENGVSDDDVVNLGKIYKRLKELGLL